MKFKINKACDLSSISVFPPQSRRSSGVPPAPQGSQQLRSQASQQTLSQGLSSQYGMFSQLSQNSSDEVVTNDQRGSQERENSLKRTSCLAPLSQSREVTQVPAARSSSNLIHKWNSASIPDRRCQISEELEHKIGMIETSISRFGMILNSVQSDVMQVSRGLKEVLLDMEGMLQKSTVTENSLELMRKQEEDVRHSLDEGLKSISDQLSKNSYQDKLQEIFFTISALPMQIETFLLKLENKLCETFAKETQALVCSLENSNQKYKATYAPSPKSAVCCASSRREPQLLNNLGVPPKDRMQPMLLPKVEMGSWNTVKANKAHEKEGFSHIQQEREWRVSIESEEEIDGGFSCLLEQKETEIGYYSIEEVKEETERILRKARRRKRKYCNTIIID